MSPYAIKELEISVTIVYGRNQNVEWEVLWYELKLIKSKISTNPWIILGDCNKVRNKHDRDGGGEYNEGVEKFNDIIEELEVTKLSSTNGYFTWSNSSRRDKLVRLRLEQSLVNEVWSAILSLAMVELFRGSTGDHDTQIVRFREEPIS